MDGGLVADTAQRLRGMQKDFRDIKQAFGLMITIIDQHTAAIAAMHARLDACAPHSDAAPAPNAGTGATA